MDNQIIAKNEDFQIFDLLYKYMRQWRWFVLSVTICCGIAFLYIKSTPNIYNRTAAVLIKDEGNMKDITAAFSDINAFKSSFNVNNEIEAFKSPYLLQEVVKRLKLNISYKTKSGLKHIELYTQSPIIAIFPDIEDQESFSFQVELLPDSVVILSDFQQGNSKLNEAIKTKLNSLTTTPIGPVTIAPTLFYASRQQTLIEITKISVKSAIEQFIGKLDVSLSSKENTIIALNFMDVSTQRADDVLTAIIAIYNESWIAEKNKVAINTSNFINNRLPLIEQELGGIDDNLEQYKSQNQLINIQSAASSYMKESSEYSGKIFEVRNQLSIARYIRKYLKDNSKLSDLLPTNTGLNNLDIESSTNQYNTLLLKRNGLIANSSDKNPVIVDMNNALHSLRQSMIQTIDNVIVTLNYQLSGLQAREDRMTKKIESNPGQEKYLISVEREQKIKESLYLYLLQKREENALSLAMTTTNTRVLNPHSGSDTPVEPKKRMILLAAFIIGMGFPVGAIWGWDILHPTVRGKKDLNALSVPLLGTIPMATQKVGDDGTPLVQENGCDVINESFRILRTDMDFMSAKSMKVVMFTSFDPGSGKTFMAINLAMSFALAGKKIVVLDLDMRTATLSKWISSPKAGIAGYLCGMTDTDERWMIVKNYFYPRFDLIPVNAIPKNPTELLLSDRLKLLLDKLKTEYDYIFIDCPPVNLVADATIIGRHSDLNVFVVREGFSDRRIPSELENIYRHKKFDHMTILLNGTVSNTPYSMMSFSQSIAKKIRNKFR